MNNKRDSQDKLKELFFLVGLAGIVGFTYLLLIPPWQHYDEPAHFEYAWLIANRANLPDIGEYDAYMRREVAASMIEHGFFDNLNYLPKINLVDGPTWIGISQLGDPPLYYLIAGIPLKLFKGMDFSTQLRLGRFISLGIYLGTIITIYLLASEFFSNQNPLRWIIPALSILLPAFTELNTAINNDVGAIFFFTLFLFSGVRIIRYGFSIIRVLALGILLSLCLLTKSTVWAALPLALIAMLLAANRHLNWPTYTPWFIALGLMIVTIFLSLSYRDAAYWYRENRSADQYNTPSRKKNPNAPLGETALEIVTSPDHEESAVLFQPLTKEIFSEEAAQLYTLGYWIWASEPTKVSISNFWVDGRSPSEEIQIGIKPKFVSFQHTIEADSSRIQVVLDPVVPTNHTVSIYFDALILAHGSFPQDVQPIYLSSSGSEGIWGEKYFNNLLQNPSADNKWFTFNPWIENTIQANSAINPYASITTFQDMKTFGWVYQGTIWNLFQSFWARFGWNNIVLSDYWYTLLLVFTGFGFLGGVYGFSKVSENQPGFWISAIVWIMLGGLIIWLQALIRPGFPFWNQTLFIPSARYAYPAVFPTMLFLGLGWLQILEIIPTKKLRSQLLLLIFISINLVSLLTIYSYYYRS